MNQECNNPVERPPQEIAGNAVVLAVQALELILVHGVRNGAELGIILHIPIGAAKWLFETCVRKAGASQKDIVSRDLENA